MYHSEQEIILSSSPFDVRHVFCLCDDPSVDSPLESSPFVVECNASRLVQMWLLLDIHLKIQSDVNN